MLMRDFLDMVTKMRRLFPTTSLIVGGSISWGRTLNYIKIRLEHKLSLFSTHNADGKIEVASKSYFGDFL